jgi:hypothetical protein
MNPIRTNAALVELAQAAEELARTCDKEAPDYAPTWHDVAHNARALAGELSRADLESFLQGIESLFSYHPGSFSEVYVMRSDPDEQAAENVKFDKQRERVMSAAAEVKAAAKEGELNTLAVRRHLTALETTMLNANLDADARTIRVLLNADELDCAAARELAASYRKRDWPEGTGVRVRLILDELQGELMSR